MQATLNLPDEMCEQCIRFDILAVQGRGPTKGQLLSFMAHVVRHIEQLRVEVATIRG